VNAKTYAECRAQGKEQFCAKEQDACFITTQKNFMNMTGLDDTVYLESDVYSGPDNLEADPDNPMPQVC